MRERLPHGQPPTCVQPSDLVGRDGVVFDALVAVAEGPVSLVGPAGAGATVTACAVASRLQDDARCGRVLFLRLDACTRPEDATRALGLALGVLLPGDEVSVQEALRQRPYAAVVVDDADLAPEAAQHVLHLGPRVSWILTGREPVVDGTVLRIKPLSDERMSRLLPTGTDPRPYRGLPLLANLPSPPAPDDPWASVRALDVDPAGLPVCADRLDDAWAPFLDPSPGRVMPRRSVREVLGLVHQPTPSVLHQLVLDRLDHLRAVATAVVNRPDHDEIVLLRAASHQITDPDLAGLAGATTARQLIGFFQVSQALTLVGELLARPDMEGALVRGLLRWVEGDAFLVQGAEERARFSHLDAAHSFRKADASELLGLMVRRCADQWTARGNLENARSWLEQARQRLALDPDPVATADTLRISADLSAQSGDLAGASALFDEAITVLLGVPEARRLLASVRIGKAGLLITSRYHAEAQQQLQEVEALGVDDEVIEATLAFRRAELALRRGRVEDARGPHDAAQSGFKRAGCIRGLILTSRLWGDMAALRGNRLAAASAYRTAIGLCMRTRDLLQLDQVLVRALAIEEEGTPGPHVDELRETLELVATLRGGVTPVSAR